MSNWISRDVKLKQRHLNKNFSKPFKKFQERESNKKERKRIREAQRQKYDSINEDEDSSYG